MSVQDFVCYVLKVPVHIDGYVYICKAIKFILTNDGDPRFYEHLCVECNKDKKCIERSLRLAKEKSISSIPESDYEKIFMRTKNDGITSKEFICYAAQFYRKEFKSEE